MLASVLRVIGPAACCDRLRVVCVYGFVVCCSWSVVWWRGCVHCGAVSVYAAAGELFAKQAGVPAAAQVFLQSLLQLCC
jgi:hypothetical protein